MHRIGSPAVIMYGYDGRKIREEWYQNGKLNRTCGPAIVDYHDNGCKSREEWYQNGEYFRDHYEPDSIKYDENGELMEETWVRKHKNFPPTVAYFPFMLKIWYPENDTDTYSQLTRNDNIMYVRRWCSS